MKRLSQDRLALPSRQPARFAARLVSWQRKHGRNDLPWQRTRSAYRIWLAEIMLQQTQVGTVVPYYQRFLERFRDVQALAAADLDEVLRLWSGLGYYSRARNLHRAAQQVVSMHRGTFPTWREALEGLPGVGRSTAAAIAAFAFGKREAILDGNVKRVLARHFGIGGFPGDSKVSRQLWALAEAQLPDKEIGRYTQALMDLGATVCTRSPHCARCPVQTSCIALAQHAVSAYPAPRPRRSVPVRDTVMLMLLHRGCVLLLKRPASGIWGGLWAFPEVPSKADVSRFCAEHLGCGIESVRALPALQHAFTHFTLRIAPLVCGVAAVPPGVQSGSARWFPLSEAQAEAVPTPVKKLLCLIEQEIEQS